MNVLVIAGSVMLICSGAMLALFAGYDIGQARQKRRDRRCLPWQPGDHEHCDLTALENDRFQMIARRDPGLGKEVHDDRPQT